MAARSIAITRVSPTAIADGSVRLPLIAYVGTDGDEVLGAGGLVWNVGMCWLWLEVADINNTRPNHIVRWARRLLRTATQMGESAVYCMRGVGEPHSARLLKLLGFECLGEEAVARVDGSIGIEEVWRWQSSQ